MAHTSANMDMLQGSISDKILKIALPLAFTSILQQLFNSADMAVVGRFAGPEALAAVGANASLINLMINLFVGLSVGANAVTARCLGAGDTERAGDSAHAAIVISGISGLILAIIGQIFPEYILNLISTPPQILPLASLYLRIYFAGMPFIMLYNFTSALFRSKGDTTSPLKALIAGGILNILLNLFFVIVLRMSVAGVALATVISNVISSLILLIKLIHANDALHIDLRKLRLPRKVLQDIAAIGVPAGLQGMLFSFSNVLIQSSINALGTATIAANAAEVTYEFLLFHVLNAFTQTNVTFIGQNRGAGNWNRCRQATRRSVAICVSVVFCIAMVFVLFRNPLMMVYTTDPEVIRLGALRFQIVIATQWINSISENLSGSLRGLGYSLPPTLIVILGVCVFRLFWILLVYPSSPSYLHLVLIYPISWVMTLSMMLLLYFSIIKKLQKETAK